MEDNDHDEEDGHHIQPVFGSTDHATGCSVQSDFSEAARSVAGSLRCWICCRRPASALLDYEMRIVKAWNLCLSLIFVLHLWELDKYRNHNKQFFPSSTSYDMDIDFGEIFPTNRSILRILLCESFVWIPR